MEISRTFCPVSREEWRDWLNKYSTTEKEIWLVFFKKHTGKSGISYDEAVEEALCFGWIDGLKKRVDDERYTYRFSPRHPGSNWSESNITRIEKLIAQDKMMPAGLLLFKAWKAKGKKTVSALKGGIPDMPETFRLELEKYPRAFNFFNNLAPSHKRNYILWIMHAKKEETRMRRIEKAIKMLEKDIKSFM